MNTDPKLLDRKTQSARYNTVETTKRE
jgi:hypothetical protein